MIVSHPYLFNTIVVLFIAFTSGWLVYVITGGRSLLLKKRIREMQAEKEKLSRNLQQLEEHLQGRQGLSGGSTTPVIPLSAPHRVNKTN
jgi:hypothetical protein